MGFCNTCKYWIGLSKLESTTWRWGDGSAADAQDTHWYFQAPAAYPNQKCAHILSEDSYKNLLTDNYFDCDHSVYALCELQRGMLIFEHLPNNKLFGLKEHALLEVFFWPSL